MEIKTIQLFLRYAIITVTCLLVFMLGLSYLALEATKKPPEVRNRIMNDLKNQIKIAKSLPKPWPPEMNRPYPDFKLIDQEGKRFNLSDYRGKVIIIEGIDMTISASQALSGAKTYGTLGTIKEAIDQNIQPIQGIITPRSEGKISLPNPDIIMIKVIYYNLKGEAATPSDASEWAQHFKLSKADNIIVAVPEIDMRSSATTYILPGYQLIDRAFNLRVDSSGTKPKHSLEMTFIPLIPKLL